MQIANVKQRQILPRVGKIWVSTPQNCTYRAWEMVRLIMLYQLLEMVLVPVIR